MKNLIFDVMLTAVSAATPRHRLPIVNVPLSLSVPAAIEASSFCLHSDGLPVCILMDFAESYRRISHWRRDKKVIPFAQPFREPGKAHQVIPQWQNDMARWVNRRELYVKCDFMDFEPRKGFLCREYFY